MKQAAQHSPRDGRRKPGVAVALSTVAVVALGIAADALAALSIRHAGSDCFVCLDMPTYGTCNKNNADYRRECNSDERASCDYTQSDGFTSGCTIDSLRPL